MAINLAIAHRKAGHFSSIYTIFSPGELAARAQEEGIPVVPFYKKRGFSLKAVLQIAQQLRQDGAQIVHTHNSAIHHYGVMAGCLAGVDAIVNTRHGLAFHSARRQEVYYRATMPLTDAVVFVCKDGQRHYTEKRIVPIRKGSVILNGIPVQQFQAFRASPGSARPRVRFGTIGRLVKAKAHEDLLAAFALLAAENPDAELHIWGDGELRPALLEAIGRHALQDRVQYHGMTHHPAAALQSIDVFVLSSISEGLPLVILEAMAAGLPIVSTRIGGVPEVAPENAVAWYSPPGDPRALAQAMRRAMESDLAARGVAAARWAEERFSIEAMQQQYERLFRRLLGARN
jgi:glycosyltransferase involved in cell wall biosynthesis